MILFNRKSRKGQKTFLAFTTFLKWKINVTWSWIFTFYLEIKKRSIFVEQNKIKIIFGKL
ncbi:hypothetical protein CBF37_11395 [Vagococcus vulneris]|uniref:Uncharacterized protein n=1 Tax=Vagococcus vulneris TaxID=1977869 RepID=A0A429ZPY8_9ENTE|nr:hypothetical protein CBF37_11395 [Vagococcus vulneris]